MVCVWCERLLPMPHTYSTMVNIGPLRPHSFTLTYIHICVQCPFEIERRCSSCTTPLQRRWNYAPYKWNKLLQTRIFRPRNERVVQKLYWNLYWFIMSLNCMSSFQSPRGFFSRFARKVFISRQKEHVTSTAYRSARRTTTAPKSTEWRPSTPFVLLRLFCGKLVLLTCQTK